MSLTHTFRITKLLQNYRSHSKILDFPNDKFYAGELTSHVDPQHGNRFLSWNKLNGLPYPVIFHAIHGRCRIALQFLLIVFHC